MKFTIEREDLSEPLVLERPFWSGALKAYLGKTPLPRIKEKGFPFAFELPARKNTMRKLLIKPGWLDPVPQVFIDTEEVKLAEKLRGIDYCFACFPVLMFLPYGPLATVCAFFLLLTSFRVLRTKSRPSLKWAAIYALYIAVFWLILAIARFAWSKGG